MAKVMDYARRLKSTVGSIPKRMYLSAKQTIAEPYGDSWWQQRTANRTTCLDLKDIKKCSRAISQKASVYSSMLDKTAASRKTLSLK
ncbi:hypothetical protein BSKO_09620 [Bryopsis sp. KO-2023]|nr:hypothetical protein BSKO_09620 [Bryopsis sp. KO-2023]